MKTLLVIVGWCLLSVLCWPLALLVIVLWPLLWLLSLPFRVVAITFDAMFALLRAILFLPARLLGYRSSSTARPSQRRTRFLSVMGQALFVGDRILARKGCL